MRPHVSLQAALAGKVAASTRGAAGGAPGAATGPAAVAEAAAGGRPGRKQEADGAARAGTGQQGGGGVGSGGGKSGGTSGASADSRAALAASVKQRLMQSVSLLLSNAGRKTLQQNATAERNGVVWCTSTHVLGKGVEHGEGCCKAAASADLESHFWLANVRNQLADVTSRNMPTPDGVHAACGCCLP